MSLEVLLRIPPSNEERDGGKELEEDKRGVAKRKKSLGQNRWNQSKALSPLALGSCVHAAPTQCVLDLDPGARMVLQLLGSARAEQRNK